MVGDLGFGIRDWWCVKIGGRWSVVGVEVKGEVGRFHAGTQSQLGIGDWVKAIGSLKDLGHKTEQTTYLDSLV